MSQEVSNSDQSKLSEKFKAKKIEVLNDILPRIIEYLQGYLSRINLGKVIDNPANFEDFGPVVLDDKDDKHSKTIKYAIDNPVILNLALTGPMGSGKSTVLKTFEHNFRQYKCLNISLATFDKKTLDTDKIEHNILKQLFYSVPHNRIPESRFKRIENLKGIRFKTLLFVLWLCSVSYFFKIDILDGLKKTLHLDYHSGILSYLYALYFVGYSAVLVFNLMRFNLNFKLTKFKIKDFDFDNGEDKKTVNFENEIDEILYFFERNPVEIVFFQDLDRFEESEIFIKLREINSLINNYEPIKKLRKITFIYAVCDDIFKENERAKFFDFIIPVIPVINYTSSSSKLLSKLTQDITDKKLTKDFIDDVSLFLNDYRTIKSIFNEYQIYKSIIGSQLESYNHLLAMMIYKNIEPTDFDLLNLNQGYVYEILENSKDLKAEELKKYTSRTEELNSKIATADEEMLKDVRELRMVYILTFFDLLLAKNNNNSAVYGFSLKEKRLTIEEILADDMFKLFTQQTNISYFYNHYSATGSSISFSELEKKVGRLKYTERLQIVKNKQAENQNVFKSELEEIERKRKDLDGKKFHEILDSNNATAYFAKYASDKQLNNLKLINYLLSGGFINEEYNHYISYFHPGSIAKEDNDFLLSLLPTEKPLEYTHQLKEIGSLVKRIKLENFSNTAILNLSLIDYLIENKRTEKLNRIIDFLGNGDQKALGFIDAYMQHGTEANRKMFFKTLSSKLNQLWDIISKSNFTLEKKNIYLGYIFSYLDLSAVKALDKSRSLSNYIQGLENLGCFYESGIVLESLKEFIKFANIEFENLSFSEEHRDFFEFIYNNFLYEINEIMIELFISNFNVKQTDVSKLKTENYTTIKNSGKSNLIKYIDENLDIYLENVFLKLENNTNESQESLCSILNNEDIEGRYDLIEFGQFSIVDLSQIKNIDIQANLIVNNKIQASWTNLLTYYKNVKTIDETLVDYINKKENYDILSKQGRIDDSDQKIKEDFGKALIKSNISEESFDKVANNLPYHYNNAQDFGDIDSSKIRIMIKSKCIRLSVINYNFIKEKFKTLLIFLVETNAEEFLKEIENYAIESALVHQIIASPNLSAQFKLSVIDKISDEVLCGSAALLEKLSVFLSDNKKNEMSFVLLDNLVDNSASDWRKTVVVNKYFSFIENENLPSIIEKIDEFSKLLSGKHPKVGNSPENKELVGNLKGKLVSKAKVSSDGEYIELFPYSKPKM